MKRARTYTISAVLAVLIALTGVWIFQIRPPSSEPRHNGKPISWYLQQLNLPDDPDDPMNRQKRDTARREAAGALRAMGPEAAAWLAQRLEKKETPGQRSYRTICEAMPAGVRKCLPAPGASPNPSGSVLDRSVLGALVLTGPPAVLILTNYLDSAKYGDSTRYEIYLNLTFMPLQPIAAAALPMLEHNLNVKNDFDRVASAYAIAQINPSRVAESVAILKAGLQTSQRVFAANCLGTLGPSAKEAAPDLEAGMDDPDPQFQREARSALHKVTGKMYPIK